MNLPGEFWAAVGALAVPLLPPLSPWCYGAEVSPGFRLKRKCRLYSLDTG